MTASDFARRRTLRSGDVDRHLVRRGLVPAALLAGALGAATPAGGATPKSVVTTAKIAGLGTVLVASHRPLYEMANDPRGHSTCTGACKSNFEPLLVSRGAVHHLGHVAGLGTIRSHGKLQVAIHGHALYFFVRDHSLSHAGGQGFENNWFTVHANGALDRTTTKSSGTAVTVPPASTSGSSPSGSSPSGSSSTTTSPTSSKSVPAMPAPTSPAPTSPPPTGPAPTSPPLTTPPTSPPPPTTTTVPPTTTTTTAPSGGGGGVGF